MEILMETILAVLLFAAAIYVHIRLPLFMESRTKIMLTHAILVLVGIAFGLTSLGYVPKGMPQLVAFVIGFGVVHLPAAIVLFIKSKRSESRF